MLTRIYLVPVSLLLIAGACDDTKPATSDTDATASGETSSTTDDAQASDSTTGDGATTEGPDSPTTSGESATQGATAGEPEPDVVSACQGLCALMAECDPSDDAKECTAACAVEVAGMDMCREEYVVLLACVADKLSCEELGDEDFASGPCASAWTSFVACAGVEPEPETCSESGTGSDTECSLLVECGDAPAEEFKCDEEVCVCLLGGEEYAQCPSEGVCMQGDLIFDKRAECCAQGG